MTRTALALLVALSLALPAAAAESRPEEPSAQTGSEEKKPDYSPRGLRQFVFETLRDDGEDGLYVDGGVGYRAGDWNLKWLPIVAPLVLSQGMGANVSAMPVVDPLVLTRTSMPYTASTWNRWTDWRERRYLRKNVEAANRKQN